VVRDPRTYVRSAMAWGAYRTGGRPLNLVPFRRLAPPQFHPRSLRDRVEWAGEGQFERLCWAWAAMNRAMREQGSGSSRFSVVRYEDLFDPVRSGATLRSLCELVGLDADDDTLSRLAERRINAGTKTAGMPEWSRWSTADRARLLRDCRSEAWRYGYDLEGEVTLPSAPVRLDTIDLVEPPPESPRWHVSAVG
jgi:hypothetical protein